ncbi:MAG: DNA repair protein RecN [Alphaproteobacteria bacterium]|nr:DNA repair protein RecN [Alphaproteobacteria bacterium]
MLNRLIISNIVLIEKLNLEFGGGLNILTGETGAGKSILMDALSLALGARSDAGLVRHGCDGASVIAEFDDCNARVRAILDENGIDVDDVLILRRTLAADGKSRAWINDCPVSVKTLKQVGDTLVEIHGQFENHALLDPTTHRHTLDEFALNHMAEYGDILGRVRDAYTAYHAADSRLRELNDMLERAAAERDFLAHNVSELSALNPQIGEEEDLATRRAAMMNAEKNAAILQEATDALAPRGVSLDGQICAVAHILQRIKTDPNPYQEQIDTLYDVAQTVAEISTALVPDDTDTDNLDAIEERLFAIRAAARKHRISADELPAKLEQMATQLNAIDNSDAELQKLKTDVVRRRSEFDAAAAALTAARKSAAADLRGQILAELPDLKLGQADFTVDIGAATPSSGGADDILFMIKTNPGTPFAPLHKSASGGELARLMLALRVVLTNGTCNHTFVFDEVDTGISGATASAVGQRLARLAHGGQALVITHSAQVAGYADKHFKIQKRADADVTTTSVTEITDDMRVNEIARIISGAEITPESIATAKTLIRH